MPETIFRTKRAVPRYPFIADVEVSGLKDGARVTARISDLSARGCYIDTLNPFALNTLVRLRIRHGHQTCELVAKVIYIHPGFGMGILFGSSRSDQMAVLAGWLRELAKN